MVSAITIAKLGGIGLALGLAFVALKNAPAIGNAFGSTVGDGIAGGLKGLSDSFSAAFDIFNVGKALTNTSAEQIVNTTGIGSNVENVPSPIVQSASSNLDNAITNEALALGGLLQSLGSPNKIDVVNRDLVGDRFRQPLDFAFDNKGRLKTGTVGVSDFVLQKQAELSKEFGIITFDTKGNVSTVGGLVSTL